MSTLGPIGAKRLGRRLMEMEAAAVVAHLVAGHPHPLKGDLAGCMALRLHKGFRLVFQGAGEHEGSTEWGRVDHVRITYIGDYHD